MFMTIGDGTDHITVDSTETTGVGIIGVGTAGMEIAGAGTVAGDITTGMEAITVQIGVMGFTEVDTMVDTMEMVGTTVTMEMDIMVVEM